MCIVRYNCQYILIQAEIRGPAACYCSGSFLVHLILHTLSSPYIGTGGMPKLSWSFKAKRI